MYIQPRDSLGKAINALRPNQPARREPTNTLNQDQVDLFWRDGFLIVPDITTAHDVARIRRIYDRMFQKGIGWREGNFFDFAGLDKDQKQASVPQMLNLSVYEPALRDSLFWVNAEAMSRQLLGPGAEWVFDHGIRKPPRVGGATPWHQDQAFHPCGSDVISLTVWLALQDVTPEMGAMAYIPGSHLGPLHEHCSPGGDDRVHGLEAIGFDVSTAVEYPVKAGTAIFHHAGTLHAAGPNLSDEPRRAFAISFGVHTGTPVVSEDYPWNARKRTARLERKRQAHEAWQEMQRNPPTLLRRMRNKLASLF
jgi:hypothetical protein